VVDLCRVTERRDIELASSPKPALRFSGRNVIAVIGIDRYHHWRRLSNAVRDATGTAALFQRLGFEQVTQHFDACEKWPGAAREK
jgi:hypothetical protein